MCSKGELSLIPLLLFRDLPFLRFHTAALTAVEPRNRRGLRREAAMCGRRTYVSSEKDAPCWPYFGAVVKSRLAVSPEYILWFEILGSTSTL